jgi:hypothetical protein
MVVDQVFAVAAGAPLETTTEAGRSKRPFNE